MTTALTVAVVPRLAAADQIADLKAEATAISEKLVQEQLEIGAYQQQYSLASAKVSSDGRIIARIGRKIGQDDRRIKKATSELRDEAIESYMDDGSGLSGSDALLFSGNVQKASLTNEYTAIAAGNIDASVDQLRTAQGSLHAHQATLVEVQVQDQSDQKQAAADLEEAVSTEHQMEGVQAEVTGQLAAAVAQQASALAASAAAAVAAAQKAATKATVPVTSAPSVPVSVAGSVPVTVPVTDPVLNAFLQCVVQAESGGDYSDVSPNGLYMGAFQFSQPTWNIAAPDAGLANLVGTPPNLASPADQDAVAIALYALDGEQPWLGDRCNS